MTWQIHEMEVREEAREEGLEEGLAKGISETVISSIRNVRESLHTTTEDAMRILRIPEGEWEHYALLLKETEDPSDRYTRY